MRQEGSGKSKGATDAVEKMLAARLRGDANAIQEQIKIIDDAYKADLSYMRGKRVFSLIDKTCKYLSLDVLDAEASPSDGLGDVCIKSKEKLNNRVVLLVFFPNSLLLISHGAWKPIEPPIKYIWVGDSVGVAHQLTNSFCNLAPTLVRFRILE